MFLFPDWYVKEVPQKRGKNGIVLTDVSILVGLKAVTIPARVMETFFPRRWIGAS